MPKNYNMPENQEWSVWIEAETIGADPKVFHIEANQEERENLARRFGIPSIEQASATITLQHMRGGTIHAMGYIKADVTQSCVVSLEPVAEHIKEEFEGWFGQAEAATVSFVKAKNEREAAKNNMEIEMVEESVEPEPIINGQFDIGELATQHLSLSLNPYPHAPGAMSAFSAGLQDDEKETSGFRKNPFEALKDWKEKR